MMVHPLVEQLRFTRSEWRRGLEGVTQNEAARRFEPMNSIAWTVGHLAWHEQLYWWQCAQGQILVAEVEQCGSGQPPCDPSLDAMWAAWETITTAADAYLDTLTTDMLDGRFVGFTSGPTIGTNLRRLTYHYWYHLGEALAIRQMLGHTNLPQFVGDINNQAPYRPE
jgi:hypothetical protein